MGYTPGDFRTTHGEDFHWELKWGPRIVLWAHDEMNQLLSLDLTNARLALQQLNLLVEMSSD